VLRESTQSGLLMRVRGREMLGDTKVGTCVRYTCERDLVRDQV
jgi:hypothetical protein